MRARGAYPRCMTIDSDGFGPRDREIERADRERLDMLDAIAAAIERRADVLSACFNAANAEDARSAIADMLAIPERHARAVTDLQFWRLTGETRRRIDKQREDIRSRLAD